MAAGEYELALPVALDAVQQGQALFKPAPALQLFPLYLLAAQVRPWTLLDIPLCSQSLPQDLCPTSGQHRCPPSVGPAVSTQKPPSVKPRPSQPDTLASRPPMHRPCTAPHPQANLGLRRAKQCEDFLSLASWLAMKEPGLTTSVMKSQLSRLYGQLYAFQSKHAEALHAFAEDVYYCALEYGPEDVRTSLGYYNMGKVFQVGGSAGVTACRVGGLGGYRVEGRL